MGEEKREEQLWHSILTPSLTGSVFRSSLSKKHSSIFHETTTDAQTCAFMSDSSVGTCLPGNEHRGPLVLRPSCGMGLPWAGREEAEMKRKGSAEK